MNITNNNRTNRSLLGFFRRGERWREIPPGYHVGDVRSDIPLAILLEATVVGNVFAPKILVEGKLYGSAVALEITIETRGQIWGDVYSGRLQVEPGGKLQGWVSNLDDVAYESMQVDGLIPDELQNRTIELAQLPAEAVESGRLARGESQVNVLRRLQMESAAAFAARDELERAFEKRLNETAGEATARAASLHEELSGVRRDLMVLREERDELREELRERTAQVERQANEIITTRDLLTERTEGLAGLRQQHEMKLEELSELLQMKNGLNNSLLEANNQIDVLTDRLRSIESALQNSLQHASEQEESLIRWQELAEVTEAKVNGLQAEINNLKFQTTENSRLNEMLRAQRKQAEDAWQAALEELEQLRQKDTHRLVPPEMLVELEDQVIQLKAALQHAEAQHQTKVAQVQQELQRAQELMLWDKAALDTTQTALEQARTELSRKQAAVDGSQATLAAQQSELVGVRAQLAQQQAIEISLKERIQRQEAALAKAESLLSARSVELAGLEEKLAERGATMSQLRTEIGRLQDNIIQLTKDREAGKQQLAQAQEQAGREASELRDRLRETRSQLEAQEIETENYFRQMQAQGQRLAEAQAILMEREIAVGQLQETAEKQKAFINRIKEVTTERMNKLNSELGQTRQQLQQAIALVNERRGR